MADVWNKTPQNQANLETFNSKLPTCQNRNDLTTHSELSKPVWPRPSKVILYKAILTDEIQPEKDQTMAVLPSTLCKVLTIRVVIKSRSQSVFMPCAINSESLSPVLQIKP